VFQGALFTRDWLKEGIAETPEWQSLASDAVGLLWNEARTLLLDHAGRKKPTEAETEDQLIYPLLEMLGWQYKSVQQNMTTKGRKDVPDALLFADEEAAERAKTLARGNAFATARRLWKRSAGIDRSIARDRGSRASHPLR
tara:strand:+ start:310 stop:732 length:423 start_codon:yes stop_codon:yes gene_type:complete